MPRRSSIVIGDVYGSLTVEKDLGLRRGKNGRNARYFLCRCKCGNSTEVRGENLKSGNTKSCGCSYKEDKIYDCIAGIDDAYDRLRYAIVIDAIETAKSATKKLADIKSGKRKLKYKDQAVEECKESIDEAIRFIKSDWFAELCDIDADTIIRRIGA